MNVKGIKSFITLVIRITILAKVSLARKNEKILTRAMNEM